MLSGVVSAEIIKLKCIDEMEKSTLEPIVDTKNKTAIVGQTKNTVFIGTSFYSLHGDRYEGEITVSMPQGKGTMHYKDGTYLEGKWVDGNLKEEKTT